MFDEKTINTVWEAATKVDGFNPNSFRKDACNAWIIRNQYGQRDSIYGWEIDHVYPVSKGGDDNLDNLRPIQWENNVKKGDSFPSYDTSVIGQDNANVKNEGHYTVNERLLEVLRQLYNF